MGTIRVAEKPSTRTNQQKIERGALALGFLSVALQRFGIGGGDDGASAQFTTVILLLAVAWAMLRVGLRMMQVNIFLYLLIVLAVCLSTGTALLARDSASIASLLLMLATYSIVLIAGPGGPPVDFGKVFFRGAVSAIKLGALLAVAQDLIQRAGGGYFDPLSTVPSQFLVSGYNTYWDLRYQGGLGQFKPNGVIFLEPSLLSLYSAVAIIYVLGRLFGAAAEGSRKSNIFWFLVLSGGFIVSASAAGVVVLAAGSIPLILGIRRNRALTIPVFGAVVVGLLSGAFNSVIAKALEGFSGNTSAALRLTLPYEYLTPYWIERPLLGWGSGEASHIIEATNGAGGLQASTLMKLLVEYGLLCALILAVVVVKCLWRSGAPTALVVAVFAAWAVPAEALLNSTLVLLLLFALPNWGTAPSPAPKTKPTPQLGRPYAHSRTFADAVRTVPTFVDSGSRPL